MNRRYIRMINIIRSVHADRLHVTVIAALLTGMLVLSACGGSMSGLQNNTSSNNQAVTDTKALAPVAGEATIYIDTVNKQAPSAKVPVLVNVGQTPQIMVNGWTVDKSAQSPAGGVVMIIDGNVEVPTTYGAERADVAKFLNNPNYTKSGFVGWINVATITKGQHILSFKVLTADKRGYYEPANKITLAIQ